jgi:hypothetical protein
MQLAALNPTLGKRRALIAIAGLGAAEVPLEAVLEDEEMLAALDAGADASASLDPDDEDLDELIGAAGGSAAAKGKKKGRGKKDNRPTIAGASAWAATAAGEKKGRAEANFNSLEYEAHQKEAAAKGYGNLYTVFGGGKEGLQACAAGALRLFHPA